MDFMSSNICEVLMIEYLSDYPPQPYFDQVLTHCCYAAKTYCHIWKHKGSDGTYRVDKKEISNEFLLHPSTVKGHLRALCREGLISIDETPNTLNVELVTWDIE